MKNEKSFTLIDSRSGSLAFKIFEFSTGGYFDYLQHNNFYSIIWVMGGKGLLKVDFSEYLFSDNTVLVFAPYQPFMLSVQENISGVCLQFHSDFYCIHRNPNETNCDTTLFNNVYQKPAVRIEPETAEILSTAIESMKKEIGEEGNLEYELLVPLLKIILVTLSRVKVTENPVSAALTSSNIPYLLTQLKTEIEKNFRTIHGAGEYASLLNISPNALAKIVKTHHKKTLTALITDRIVVEAKRQLYMTNKPVKEIAWLLGYEDEFYFSRVFKKYTDVSPQHYRETVGFGKAENN